MALNTSPLHLTTAAAIRQFDLCRPGDRIIVAVSGGADSVALLDLLATLPDFPLQLVVAHMNHGLRGSESDEDERFVRELADGYGLVCETALCDVRGLARQLRSSLEDAGRTARYDFFQRLRQKHGATAVAVGHHRDDQAETFLIRLLRGSGTTGLASMAPRTASGVIRPLLTVGRQELRHYCEERRLPFREDRSNADPSFLRNRVRHQLLPLLAGFNPSVSRQLAATAQLLGEDEALLGHCTDAVFNQLAQGGAGWTALQQNGLTAQPRPLRLRLYRKALQAIRGSLQRYELRHFLLLDELLQRRQTGERLNLPGTVVALVTGSHLLLALQTALLTSPPHETVLEGPGTYELGNGLILSVLFTAPPSNWSELTATTCYLDPQQAPFPWLVRAHRPGERLDQIGTEGSRKIQDILTDLKLPRHLRHAVPLLCCNGTPLWLAGVRRSRHALLSGKTVRAVQVTLLGTERLPLFPDLGATGPQKPCRSASICASLNPFHQAT